MKKIPTGRGSISPLTLLAIWSVSAITSLPGLAVSPIIGQLDTIFTNVSVLNIPSILLSGQLAITGNKLLILITGLMIFMISSVLCFFAESIRALLYISLLLGVGAGIVIPLSTSLINDFFTGKYRIRQFGISSFITNLTLVLATVLTGWLAEINWHYPFFIYLLCPFFNTGLSFIQCLGRVDVIHLFPGHDVTGAFY
ncbi:MFS transporter [Endozoicomonas sp. ONNA2]|uniref:MFS transporter n=1 Tax=Endozoicomonas sp. ONNA2 TaxID=2828741 RepID=UPI002147DB4E